MKVQVSQKSQINTYWLSTQAEPTLTKYVDGNVIVGWSSWLQDGSMYGVYAQSLDENLVKVNPEFQVATETFGQQKFPEFYQIDSETVLATWNNRSVRKVQSDGTLGEEFTINGLGNSSIFLINPDNYQSYFETISVSNDKIILHQVNFDDFSAFELWEESGAPGSIDSIEAIRLENDTLVVFASEYGLDGSGWGIKRLTLSGENTLIDFVEKINSIAAGDQFTKSAASLDDSTYGLLWASAINNSSRYDLYFSVYENQSGELLNEFLVDTNIWAYKWQGAEIVSYDDGKYLLVYSDDNSILAKQYSPSDSQISDIGTIYEGQVTIGDLQMAQVDPTKFSMVWVERGTDGDETGIFGASFIISVNSTPSGRPAIEGTAAIGETLRVNTESITDDDGLGEFSYQWMRDGAIISGATGSTYLVTADDGDAVLSVGVSYTDQLGTLESLTSDITPTIVSPHAYADNFTITSSFGTSVYEGTLSGPEEGSGNQISFTINQIDPQIRSVYVALQPASGQTTDFWDNFWSNKIGGEPADQFALGTFTSVDGGPVTVSYTLNADRVVEEDETFVFSVYEDNMDFALGRKAIKSVEFSVLDDDATLTFTSDLYYRSGEDLSGFQLSSSDESATETYVTDGTGMFEWSGTPGATVEFVSATAYSNSSKAVTSADALDALKLSVGLTPSNGTPNAYDYIAADFNRDGKVTSSDALNILKYAVGLEVERDAEWVFIRSDDDLSAVGKNSVEYDANILIEDISSDAEISLTGILIGDVNDSYVGMIL